MTRSLWRSRTAHITVARKQSERERQQTTDTLQGQDSMVGEAPPPHFYYFPIMPSNEESSYTLTLN
jgi:hypothetical protein